MPAYVTFHRIRNGGKSAGVSVPMLGPRLGNSATLSIGASAQSTSGAAAAGLARVATDTACRVEIGTAATANSMVMLANSEREFEVAAGDIVSVIQV